ncbi:ATP-dependent helicase family protein [Hirschfeldia incana]|nr:ATP-dependent helicase family protein [Hirschfeldia incana]
MMGSAAENEAIVHTSPQILTTSSNSQDQACDVEMLPVPQASSPELLLPLIVDEDMTTTTTASHDALLDQEFVVPFPDPTSTLDIHGFATSHQGVQGTSSSEQIAFRAASSVNHSEAVQPTNNISHGGGSTLNTSLANNPTMGHYPPRHLFNDPYEYELEKIRLEEDHLKKSFDEMTSQLMAELERKMAEARSQFERESQELDAKVMEVETNMGLVRTGSLLANAFVSKCSERSASNDLAAVRAMISQQSTQQQQTVQANTQMSSTAPPRVRPQQESTRMSTTSAPPRPSVTSLEAPILLNSLGPLPRHHPTPQPSPMSQQTVHTHMNSTAPPRPSVTPVEIPILNSPGPLPHLPRRTTAQTSLMSQQTHTHVSSTAPPPSPPSVTSVEPQTPTTHLRPLVRFPRTTTTQPSPLSQQASNTNVSSTSLPRPSSVTTTEALPLHSPLSNTPRPRPRPVISNLTPTSSSSSTPAVRGPTPHTVRASAPHLGRRPAPHVRPFGSSPAPVSAPMSAPPAAAASATHPRSSVQEQEQQQQQGRSNDGLVHLSDDD